MIQNLLSGILFCIISSIKRFYIRPHIPVDSIRAFFNFRFSSRKSQSQQKLAKKITHFTIQFRSKTLTSFTNLNSHDIENNMLPKHSQKTFSLYKFSGKHFSVWCQKKPFARHYSLTSKNYILAFRYLHL